MIPSPTPTWPPFLSGQRQGACFEVVDLDVVAGHDVAWAHALLRCGTPDELAEVPQRRLRLTIGLRRDAGRWVVAHEHHSFPYRPPDPDDPARAARRTRDEPRAAMPALAYDRSPVRWEA